MKKNAIQKELTDAVKSLLEMARDLTFNKISSNCFFITSEIERSERNSFEQNKIRINSNNKKTAKTLADVIPDIEKLYDNLYDLNLYVYKTEKKQTIIEIQYYPLSSLDFDYQKKIERTEPMLHFKIYTPPYYSENNKKFDIH
ncbi:hypothetical protein [Flavobacterium ajazii]|uniref:hypothetical protein n=1 Tax=Flavobacterium ajazii TaxID=2692318 RepID=UPI0013D31573|nr:hypothetical protein [Flavobacterium ajazii]